MEAAAGLCVTVMACAGDVGEMSEGLSVLILAGGRSRRMGQDKSWMVLDGMPLVERVVRRVLPLADEVLLSREHRRNLLTSSRGLSAVPARVVADLYPDAGPLAGLHAGLGAARNDLMLALAGDMPFVSQALVQHMVALAPGFDAVICEVPSRRTGETFREPYTRSTGGPACRPCPLDWPRVSAR